MPTSPFKLFRLSVFSQTYDDSSQEFFLHQSDFPSASEGQVVEVYQADQRDDEEDGDDGHRSRKHGGKKSRQKLFLQITAKCLYPSNGIKKTLARDTVYIQSSVCEAFRLINFRNVHVRVLDGEECQRLHLDSVELTFREQYLGRAEMWRLKSSLRGMCVHAGQRVNLAKGAARCQVHEMYNDSGEKVTCGIVSNETKVVFRSPTAMIYLFIQMSSEMWQYDERGQLFYHKAVDGFMADLFARWREAGSSHEVTIAFFSRCIYDGVRGLESLPDDDMRACMEVNDKGEFYEDFYRVVVQNERFDDWTPTLLELKKLMNEYRDFIVNYHDLGDDENSPRPRISSAKEGNFLEVLNVSLNTFENHFLNRNLDRTGQQSMIITPGVGLFEVNREWTEMTEQRILDSGVGSDLICLGEQPLHAVPLLVFGEKEFTMPHWINLSFYTWDTKAPVVAETFDARIAPPATESQRGYLFMENKQGFEEPDDLSLGPSEVKYEGMYDSRLDIDEDFLLEDVDQFDGDKGVNKIRKFSHTLEKIGSSAVPTISMQEKRVSRRTKSESVQTLEHNVVGGGTQFDHQAIKKMLLFPGRSLLNPFTPDQAQITLTSNRRRWTHIFPHDIVGSSKESSNNIIPFEEEHLTSVDWKSLTIPATLPITTDYFPDQKKIEDDYGFNEYEMFPDDINADFRDRTPLDEKSMTREQIFLELVSQRLAQGFQLVLNAPPQFYFSASYTSSKCKEGNAAQKSEDGGEMQNLDYKSAAKAQTSSIRVTILRPTRGMTESGKKFYKYRFRAPDNDTYEVSWQNFRTANLHTFPFNHLDYYVATKGYCSRDYPLEENLKFWRFRMYAVPQSSKAINVTKKIVEFSSGEPCDLYDDIFSEIPSSTRCDNFHRFIDSCINRLKRKAASGDEDKTRIILSLEKNSLAEIVEAMKSPVHGLPFFVDNAVFPRYTFLAADAVHWLVNRVSRMSPSSATSLCRDLLENNLICHTSGCLDVPFLNGYVFYSILTQEGGSFHYHGDLDMFHNDWVESVAVSECRPRAYRTSYYSLQASMGRPEWIHVCHQSEFYSTLESAYDLRIHWTVATGNIVTDLVQGWARKAQQTSMALIPVPGDPFALPISLKSDPIRGPIFVELDTKLFADEDEQRVLRFRQLIAQRFGFVICTNHTEKESNPFSTDHQFIHCTGNFFLLIPTRMDINDGRGIQGIKHWKGNAANERPTYDHSTTGFLWSWNFMVSRRWKNLNCTGATGNIPFMDKLLLDFRKFCSSSDGRLAKFWEQFCQH